MAASRCTGPRDALAVLSILLLLVLPLPCRGQCISGSSSFDASYRQHQWNKVVESAETLNHRNADETYQFGMALAYLQRWGLAEQILAAGARQCPQQERFRLELAGVAFQQKDYPKSTARLRQAIRLAPNDDYALNFAATNYFLMGNIEAALKYWNRIHKPLIANLSFDPQLHLRRQVLDRAVAFAPASQLHLRDYMATETRLRALSIFPVFQIPLASNSDGTLDASLHAIERNGFGNSRIQSILSTFGGVFYETIYPGYFNLARSATNIQGLLRWDAQKRRAWISVESPLHQLPRWHWQMSADLRNENWIVRRSFTGTAPPLGSLNLRRQVVSGTIEGMPRGSLQWFTGAEISHRVFRNVNYGSALNSDLIAPGYGVKHLASIRDRIFNLPERRFTIDAAASSEFARLWSTPAHLYEKLQASANASWIPQASGDLYDLHQRLRVGRTFGAAPFDELYMLGVERDNSLWLRGAIGTRDGRKGSSPLGSNYVLSNSDFERRLYSNGLITIRLGPWLDIGQAGTPTASLTPRGWLFSAGLQTRLSVLGTAVLFTWGRDLRAGTNAFYGTVANQ